MSGPGGWNRDETLCGDEQRQKCILILPASSAPRASFQTDGLEARLIVAAGGGGGSLRMDELCRRRSRSQLGLSHGDTTATAANLLVFQLPPRHIGAGQTYGGSGGSSAPDGGFGYGGIGQGSCSSNGGGGGGVKQVRSVWRVAPSIPVDNGSSEMPIGGVLNGEEVIDFEIDEGHGLGLTSFGKSRGSLLQRLSLVVWG